MILGAQPKSDERKDLALYILQRWNERTQVWMFYGSMPDINEAIDWQHTSPDDRRVIDRETRAIIAAPADVDQTLPTVAGGTTETLS